MTDLAIEVVDLHKSYGNLVAVAGIDLAVREGSTFGMLGPNGAGKTSTVEILEGYRQPDAGRVRVFGTDPWRQGDRLRGRVGVMLQAGGLQPGIRVLEAMRLFGAFYPDPLEPVALLERVGLTDRAHAQVRRLSGGEYQRLSLALALIGQPELVFLDEPTAGLDPHAREMTWDVIREMQARNVTIVLTTHAMPEAEALCDQLAIIDHGRIVASGTPAELTGADRGREIAFRVDAALAPSTIAAVLGVADHEVERPADGRYVVRAPATPALIATLTAWLRDQDLTLDELSTGRRTLEEVFLRLTAEEALTTNDEPGAAGEYS